MKFPSLETLLLGFINTVKRFPFEVLFALVGTLAAIVNTQWLNINATGSNWCTRIMFTANLGLLLSLAVTLYTSERNIKQSNRFLFKLFVAIFAAGLILILNPKERSSDYFRFFLLSFGFHLLISFSAFTDRAHIQGFWQFNKTIFLRFLESVLYSGVLYLGLSAALGAANFLFSFNIEWHIYTILWYCIVGIFNTLFFLAGVPAQITLLDNDFSYPKGLKVFTQYVLIPLATVYLCILLAYEVKVIIQWSLPKGLVSKLILGYAIFGILSILLIYPVREQEENRWIKTYARSFYFLLIPLLALLLIAVGVRLVDYGITEFRYFLIMLALWLIFITIYFLLFKKQNIKIIPISLSIVTFLSVYGPQSAFSIALYSQRSILINILKRNNSYKNGKLLPVKNISQADGDRAAEVLDYLITRHDFSSSLQPYVITNLSMINDSLNKQRNKLNKDYIDNYELHNEKLKWILNYLGLNKFSGSVSDIVYSDTTSSNKNYSLIRDGDILDIYKYDFFIDAKGYVDSSSTNKMFNGIKFTEKKTQSNNYSLEINNEIAAFNLIDFVGKTMAAKNKLTKVNNIANDDTEKYIAPDSLLLITHETSHYIITLEINKIMFNQIKGVFYISYTDANYLVKKKR